MGSVAENRLVERIEVFEYPVTPTPSVQTFLDTEISDANVADEIEHKPEVLTPEGDADFRGQMAEEAQRSFEAGRERGNVEGRQAEREAQAAARADAEERHRRQVAEVLEQFAQERDRYLHAVEHEVVQLALAVAARILRREAQMDPLLLTGAVRVALGQLSENTRARLRVPADEVELWKETIALLPNLALKPALEAAEDMHTGECILETELGSVDLGVRAQLAEIERGFFDRAGHATLANTPTSSTANREAGK